MSRVVPVLRCPPSAPRGFTLVEALVALVLLSVGALALVAASAASIRSVSASASQTAAVSAARHRLELVASIACTTLPDTAALDSSGSIREHWSIRSGRNATRLATDSVEYTDRAGDHLVVLRRLVACW